MRAYRLAYDGRPFRGFQRQPDVPTVEDALFDALRALDALDPDADKSAGDPGVDKPAGYAAAGRTDAGVSARAQTVAFDGPPWLSPSALNAELPASVLAWASADAPLDFHATHDARSREYVYHLYAPPDDDDGGRDAAGPTDGSARDAGRTDDDDRARAALDRLCGEHDFHNLTLDDRGTVRDLDVTVERDGDFLAVRLRSGGFARQLVRRVVGLAAEVASGESPVEKVDRVLAAEPLDGPEGVAPAPAEPLVLWDVDYDVEFAVDADAAADARAVFGSRRRTWRTASRVAGTIRDGIE